MRKIVFVLIFTFIISGIPVFSWTPAYAITSPPEIVAETAILMDATTGEILFGKYEHLLREPASTTKVMTALLALEHLPLDKVITIDPISPFTGGSRIFVIEGEELTVEQLIYAAMLVSANDATVALAIAISGSVEEFAVLMNERAREIGARNPLYKNPSGLHQEGHFASAYDLAVVAREAMKNPRFRQIVSTVLYTIPATNKQPERNYIHNTNRLLFDYRTMSPVRGVMTPVRYQGTTGIKTGFTPQAGAALVSSAKRDGTELIAVVLASTPEARFGDSIALLDYGFENFFTHRAVDANTLLEDAIVRRGAVNTVAVRILEDKYITLPREASTALITTEIVMDENITAPVTAGQILGKIEVYEGSDLIGEVPIVAVSDIAEGRFLSRFGIEDSVSEIVTRYAIIVGIIIGALLFLYLIVSIVHAQRKQARRRARAWQIALERAEKQREMEQRKWPY